MTQGSYFIPVHKSPDRGGFGYAVHGDPKPSLKLSVTSYFPNLAT